MPFIVEWPPKEEEERGKKKPPAQGGRGRPNRKKIAVGAG
jgi:hypothetical protein